MNKIVPLYTAKTIITLDICKKTTLTISRKIKLEIIALVEIFCVLVAILVNMSLEINPIILGILWLLISALIPVAMHYFLMRSVKKYYEQSKQLANKICHYQFYEDTVVVTTSSSTITIVYDECYQVILTPEIIYLKITPKQFYIIEKQHASDGLEAFLIEKSSLFSAKKKAIYTK